jgi:hypothetical protein
LRAEIVGGSAGLGGQQRGEGVRVVGDRLLLAREQRGAGSDHTVDRPQPCESLRVTGFDLGEQAAVRQQAAAERVALPG